MYSTYVHTIYLIFLFINFSFYIFSKKNSMFPKWLQEGGYSLNCCCAEV